MTIDYVLDEAINHPLKIFYSLFVIFTYIKVKGFRRKPGSLFFMIAVDDFLFGIVSGLNALNSKFNIISERVHLNKECLIYGIVTFYVVL